jgi:LysR family transcriptional regulator, regulator for bpeEF and oprC
MTPAGRLHTNSADVLRHAAVSGLGLAQVLELYVREELERGSLEAVLPEYEPAMRTIYALYAREKASLPRVA